MTSAVLQLIAIATMAIDHIGILVPAGPVYWILRGIGRTAFPLFVFMLAEGFVHTGSLRKYSARLCVFALVSELPYHFFMLGPYWLDSLRNDPVSNVFYELILIFTALLGIKLAREKHWLLCALTVLSVVLAEAVGTMYGAYGVLLGVCFYLFRERRWLCVLSLAALTVIYCLRHGNILDIQIYAILAAVPVWLYNGERGKRLPRYFAYAFYPAHLLLLCGIDWIIRLT